MSAVMKFIHFEKIDFDSPVEITLKELVPIPYCQKTFYIDKLISL